MSGATSKKKDAEKIVDNEETGGGEKGAEAAGAKEKASVATQLVELAEAAYNLGVTPGGEPYATPKSGPPITRQLRGGKQSLRAELAHRFYETAGMTASQTALADCCLVLEGMAHRADPEELHLRVARVDRDSFALDLGDTTGRCIIYGPTGWRLVDTPPALFRRTNLTCALPDPIRGGDLTKLWTALNVAKKYRPVLLAVLVCALIPDYVHPVVLLAGEQGVGKTTAAARLAGIVDPTTPQVRKAPRDAEAWTTAAAGSWVAALDNLSAVPDWLSDALCRAATGDGDVKRRLYTDGDLHVIAFRRCVIINGIDVGALRGDLADRLVHLVLDLIPETARLSEQAMTEAWQEMHPKVLGGLLDLTVKVLGKLPEVKLDRAPRLVDFARILKAVDEVQDTDGLDVYLGLRDELAQDAAGSDPLLVALVEHITDTFTGTSAELLTAVEPQDAEERKKWRAPKDWPGSARALTGQMRRNAPTLRRLGWTVTELDRNTSRTKQLRWELTPPEQRGGAKGAAVAAVAANSASPQVNGGGGGAANSAATVRQSGHDAAGAANGHSSPRDAALFAAPGTPHVTSGNEDHAASAATAASNPPPLCSVTPCSMCKLPTLGGRDHQGRCTHCVPSQEVKSA